MTSYPQAFANRKTDYQAGSLDAKGVKSVAINADTLAVALKSGLDLWEEA